MAQPKKNRKKGSAVGWLIFAAILLLSRLAESGGFDGVRRWFRRTSWQMERQFKDLSLDESMIPLVICTVVAVVIALVFLGVKNARASGEARTRRDGRVSAAVQRRDPRARSFTPPEPSCIVCDHTGEDHFQRDKLTRIRQLDEWLKNGLIDREEYKVLKRRFERDL